MDQRKIKKFKELIDSFDTGFYEEKIDNLEKEINNISMGRPRLEGIRNYGNNKIVPLNEREKEINKLKKEIRTIREDLKDYRSALSQLRTSADKLEALAEKDLLLTAFKRIIASREFSQIEETDVYLENKEEYKKLYSKSKDKISSERSKISKNLYKLIKKNKDLKVHEIYERYEFIESAFKYNKIDVSDKTSPGNRIFGDIHKKYINSLEPLGVDVNKINHVKEMMKSEPTSLTLTWHANESLNGLKSINRFEEKRYNIKGGYAELRNIKEKYEQIIEFSRECWFIDEVLIVFESTDIVQTEMYRGLQVLNKNNKDELMNLVNKADNLFENSEISLIISLEAKLQELYRQAVVINKEIEEYENLGNYRQTGFIKTDYYNLRYEMIKILKEHPELNRPEYDIDIESIIKKEKELYEPEIKKQFLEKESSKIVDEAIASEDKEPIVETKQVEDKKEIENISERFELDSNLQVFRTMHYQDYMKEKILGSQLGNLSFSNYLVTVAPNLIELINIEKERESLARTIYREYMIYYSALEDKNLAMSFDEYSTKNYGLSGIEVPIEYNEEYEGMKIR